MRGITDYCLIEIPDLYQDTALHIGEWPKIANVAIAANPQGWTFRQSAVVAILQPFIKPDGTSAHIGVRRPRHLEIPRLRQNLLAVIGLCHPSENQSTRPSWSNPT